LTLVKHSGLSRADEEKKVVVVLPPEGTGPEAHVLHIVAAYRGRAEGLPVFNVINLFYSLLAREAK
jgi:hypothetical protein